MIRPKAIAVIAIFIIGAEMLILCSVPVISRLAIKYSKFNLCLFYTESKIQFSFGFWYCPLAETLQKTDKTTNDSTSVREEISPQQPIIVAANQTATYLPLLKGKSIGIVANQTSVIFKENGHTHLVDSLVALGVNVKKVFAPEHGFRGKADAGEKVKDGTDVKTGLPLISLYGKNRKPSSAQLEGLDVVLFDIQDVGVRFYTYIATLQLVMEACAKNNIPIIVFDRPNPNAHFVDGPTMQPKHSGFFRNERNSFSVWNDHW